MATRFAVRVQTRSSSCNLLDHSLMVRFVVKKVNAELRAAEDGCSVVTLPRSMSCASVIRFGVEKVEAFRSLQAHMSGSTGTPRVITVRECME